MRMRCGMMCEGSICRNCFHSYVCEQFNDHKDDNNKRCHFFNDHYVPTADVAPKAEVAILSFQKAAAEYAKRELQYDIDTLKGVGEILNAKLKKSIPMAIEHAKEEVAREIFAEIYEDCFDQYGYINYEALAELKKKYIGE